jgi:hypothetical protein
MRKLELASLFTALFTLPLATSWEIVRVDFGVVVLYLGASHGIHESDIVTLALAVPIWMLLFCQLIRVLSESRRLRQRRGVFSHFEQ